MVLLTMTASIVEALHDLRDPSPDTDTSEPADAGDDATKQSSDTEPSIADPAIGNPISHGQTVDLWKHCRARGLESHSLEQLLQGASVYIPPPPPKPEPTPEYKALMARLRHEQEQRTYERMLHASSPTTAAAAAPTKTQPQPPTLRESFASVNAPISPHSSSPDQDESLATLHADLQRQLSLILNFLLSIAGCGGAIWFATRWWGVTARILTTLAGCIVVAGAEVVVYMAWSWRMAEGERKLSGVREVREIIGTWVVGDAGSGGMGMGKGKKEGYEELVVLPDEDTDGDGGKGVRRRMVARAPT